MDKWYIGLTEDAIRQRVVAEAVKYLGVREGTKEHKKIVDTYNSQSKLPRGYKLQYTDAWCAGFISFLGIVLGISNIILPEVGCGSMLELYREAGRWEEWDAFVPRPGDLVMYAWKGQEGENTLAPNHVGMVVSVKGKTIRVLEGNYENQVQCRDIGVEYIKIRGFCMPDYASLVQWYKDVPLNAWYKDEVYRARELGLMEGVGGGKFEPDRAPTRAELAAVAVRIVELMAK